MSDKPKTLKELDLKLDTTKFGKLREDHLKVFVDGTTVSVLHEPTGINIHSGTRDSVRENWEIAQQGINSALEHQESVGMGQAEAGGHR